MSTLLRAELLKLRTTRTFAALVAAAVALSLVAVGLTAALSSDLDRDDVRSILTTDFTGLFVAILGIFGMAGEWRHRTITGTFLATPSISRLLIAKSIAFAVAGIVLSAIVTLSIMAVASGILSLRDELTPEFGQMVDVLWRNLIVAAFAGVLGVALGGLVHNQVFGMFALLALGFIIEPTLLGLAEHVGRYGPTVGAPTAFLDIEGFDGESDLLAPGVALLVMAAWNAGLLALAAVRLRRGDIV